MAKKIETVWRTNQTKATRVGYIYKICHDSRKRDGGGEKGMPFDLNCYKANQKKGWNVYGTFHKCEQQTNKQRNRHSGQQFTPFFTFTFFFSLSVFFFYIYLTQRYRGGPFLSQRGNRRENKRRGHFVCAWGAIPDKPRVVQLSASSK